MESARESSILVEKWGVLTENRDFRAISVEFRLLGPPPGLLSEYVGLCPHSMDLRPQGITPIFDIGESS